MPLDRHLHVVAGIKKSKTFLKQSYYKQPFKLANITENKAHGMLRLMLTSSSPGILSNDHYNFEIDVEEKASVHITTQGYQRLFTMAGVASQIMNVHVENNGSFTFLPHPIVPHKASDFSSINNIFLEEKHHLIWSDILTCGRKLSGEEFLFTKFKNITTIYLNKKIVVKENILIEPSKKNLHALGQMEGYTHQSSLLFINDIADMEKIAQAAREMLLHKKEILFGISLLPVNGLIFRILGQKGEKLFDYHNELAALIENIIR